MPDIVYVAIPYTDPDPEVRDGRWHLANLAAAHLIKTRNTIVYSPITMTDPLDRVLAGSGKTLGSDYWVNFDEAFMATCSSIAVVKIPGWDKSGGVKREIQRFAESGRPVEYIEPDEIFKALTPAELKAVPAAAWRAVSEDLREQYKPKPVAKLVPPRPGF